jgi:subtilisin family serine protease/chitodextrinase
MRLKASLGWMVFLTACGVASAAAATLDLPIRRPGAAPTGGASYAGNACVVQLAPRSAAQARAARAAFASGGEGERFTALGVAGVDRVAQELGGVRFEPEFRGETPPAPGSGDPDFTAFYVAHLPAGAALETALDAFRGLGEVVAADPIAILHVSATPNDSLYATSFWLHQANGHDIHAPEAWNVTTGDTSIVVAVLDTGVLSWHPDLAGSIAGLSGNLWTNWIEAAGQPGVDDDHNGFVDDVHGWDFVNVLPDPYLVAGEDGADEDNDPNDFDGHGTAVAGAIGAMTNNTIGVSGVVWNARIMPVRMGWSEYDGAGTVGTIDMVTAAKAVRYATRMGASVINCSWESVFDSGLAAAVGAAVRAGVTIVTAAGNLSPNHYLSDRDDVISVTATDDDVVWQYSNTGSYVDISAPGVNLTSTWLVHAGADSVAQRLPAYTNDLSGTSMASPLVAGAAALVQAQWRATGALHPLTPRGVQLRLMETADDIRALNPSPPGPYGAGRLNAARAVSEVTGSTAMRTHSRSVGPSVLIPSNGGGSRVAFVTQNRRLLIVDPVSLDTLANTALVGTPTSGVAAADLGGGLGVGLFVATLEGSVEAFDLAGAPLANWPQAASGALDAGAALADLDGDGVLEVIAGAGDGQIWAWHADGNVVQGFPFACPDPVTAIAISNLAGTRAIVAATQSGLIFAVDRNGAPIGGWPVDVGGAAQPPIIAQLGFLPGPTVVVGSGTQLHAFDPSGGERAGFPITLPGNVGPLAAADVDLDGHDEIVAVVGASIDVRDATGTSLAGWPHAAGANVIGPPVLGDLSPGARPDILVMTANGLAALDGTANPLATFPKPGMAGAEPSIVQADGDSHLEVLAGTGSDSLDYVYDAGPGSSAATPRTWFTPRGNFARTGSTLYAPAMGSADVIAPVAIGDLRAGAIGAGSIQLLWSAPFDDPSGRAAQYEVRRSAAPITIANFGSATLVNGAPTPAVAGAPESLTVSGLSEGTPWYFAVRAHDAAGNVSAISNVLQASIATASPAAVVDLHVVAVTDSSVTLGWTATGDDGTIGRPNRYAVRADLQAMDDAGYATAPLQRVVGATVDAGGSEVLLFRGLQAARRYWFALKAIDGTGNVSPLSNVVDTQTGVGGPLNGRQGIALAVLEQPSRGSARLYWQSAPGAEPSTQRIAIFDLNGRLLRTLEVGPGVGGKTTWDGRDDRGRHVPAGLYCARLISGSIHVQTRLVLLP